MNEQNSTGFWKSVIIQIAWFWKSVIIQIAGFWKSVIIQIAGFWKSFQISNERNSKNIQLKNPIFVVNNQPRRYCKIHTILFAKSNLKVIKLIKTVFL